MVRPTWTTGEGHERFVRTRGMAVEISRRWVELFPQTETVTNTIVQLIQLPTLA